MSDNYPEGVERLSPPWADDSPYSRDFGEGMEDEEEQDNDDIIHEAIEEKNND